MLLIFPYCTVPEVREFTGNSDDDEEDNIIAAINLASRSIDEWCRRDFKFHDHTTTALEINDGGDIIGRELYLPFPIISMTEAEVRWGKDSDPIGNDELDWRIQTDSQKAFSIIFFNQNLPDLTWPDNYVKLTGTFGYGSGIEAATPSVDLPSSVRRAAMEIAGVWAGLKRKEVVALDGAKLSLLDEKIPREVKDMLRPYQKSLM